MQFFFPLSYFSLYLSVSLLLSPSLSLSPSRLLSLSLSLSPSLLLLFLSLSLSLSASLLLSMSLSVCLLCSVSFPWFFLLSSRSSCNLSFAFVLSPLDCPPDDSASLWWYLSYAASSFSSLTLTAGAQGEEERADRPSLVDSFSARFFSFFSFFFFFFSFLSKIERVLLIFLAQRVWIFESSSHFASTIVWCQPKSHTEHQWKVDLPRCFCQKSSHKTL